MNGYHVHAMRMKLWTLLSCMLLINTQGIENVFESFHNR